MPNWKKVVTSGSSPSFNEITASGNISASGAITSSGFNLIGTGTAELEVDGNITASGDISSSGTIIGKINTIDTSADASHFPRFGLLGGAADLNTTNGWSFNPSSDTMTLGSDGVILAGQSGHITASGDISGSGATSTAHMKRFFARDRIATPEIDEFTTGGGLLVVPPITASGDISSSGTITMLTASIGGGIFTSASLASGGGGGGTTTNGLTAGTGVDMGNGTGGQVFNGSSALTMNLDLTEVIASDGANRVLTSDGDGNLTAHEDVTIMAGAITASHISSSGNIKAQNLGFDQGNSTGIILNGGEKPIISLNAAGALQFGAVHSSNTQHKGVNIYVTGSSTDGLFLDTAGNVTASGHISSSGNVITNQLTASAVSASGQIAGSNLSGTNTGDITLSGTPDYITISNQVITRGQIDLTTDVTGVLPSANLDSDTAHLTTDQTFSGNKTFSAPITASGDISASGKLFVTQTIVCDNDIQAGVDVKVGRDVVHLGDGNTKIGFDTDKISIGAGGSDHLVIQQGQITASGEISASGTGNYYFGGDVNLHQGKSIKNISNANQYIELGGSGLSLNGGVIVNEQEGDVDFQVRNQAGETPIVINGDVSGVQLFGPVTASAEISASGDITTPYLLINPGSATSNQKLLEGKVGALQKFTFDEDGDLQLDGNITCGGDIYITDKSLQIDSDDADDTGPMIYLEKNGTSGATQTFFRVENDGSEVFQLEGENSNTTMVLQLYGYTALEDARYVKTSGAGSYVDIQGTTDATSANGDNGALRVEGGASIAKSVYVGSDIILTGNPSKISGSVSSTGSFGQISAISMSLGGGIFTSASLAAGGGGGGGSMSDFTLTADGGSNQTIADGQTLDIAGGTNITTAVGSTDTVTVNLDASPSITNLSATGTVSASGDLNLGYKPDAGSYISASSDGTIEMSGSGTTAILNVEGSITASAISSSGTIYGLNYWVGDRKFANASITDSAGIELGNSGDGNLKLTHITASGDISSSGALLANTLTVDGLSTQASEVTAVTINGSNVFGTRDLGTAAFTATTAYATAAQGTTADNAVQPADTFYIGTTSVAHNRSSAALTLAGITLTTPDIGTPSGGTLTNCTFPTLNQSTTGTAAIATTVTITDNESTDEDNAIVFTAGGDVDGGNLGLESDGDLTYNPSTGTLTTTVLNTTTNKFTKTGTTDAEAQGDVVYFGGTTSMDNGKIYHYKSDGTWELVNADDVSTADGLLAVALGAASDTNGMLLRGMVTLDHDPGEVGDVLYVQSDNAGTPGEATATKPTVSGDIVRVVGYCLDASNGQIWFNPDNTFVEVA